ncbi:MAG: PKD domain-containing protein [Chitinophagales bacterium]|nr:PKD domain-containing protein [Chitinophagales bacterium]
MFSVSTGLHGQVPGDMSQHHYGGNNLDYEINMRPLDSGGLLIATETLTGIDGDKTEDFGGTDTWIFRLDSNKNIIWEHTYGGDAADGDPVMVAASDGGFYVAISSNSDSSGNKTIHTLGGFDIWLFKMDAWGNIEWQTAYGGANDEFVRSMIMTSDGHLMLAAYSDSDVSGNKTVENVGGYDIWLLKLDSMGNKIWDSRAGSEGWDITYTNCLVERPNGNYLIAGWSEGSVEGDKTIPAYGSDDYWLVEFDTTGTIVWQGVYGWTSIDVATGLINLGDGGFLVTGDSQSGIGGNKSAPNFGFSDFWILRFDADRNLIWNKTYGGASGDYGPSGLVAWPDGSIVVAGYSLSGISGNKTETNYGGTDFWMLRLDLDGNILWQKEHGGSSADIYPQLASNSAFELYLAGPSQSPADGTKTVGTYGNMDTWLIHLEASDVCTDITVTIDTTVINANVTLADGSIADSSGTYYLTYDTPECDTSYIYNIQIIRTPVVNFTYSADLLDVSFTDLSENEPDSWLWYFGDGTTSAEQDPVHTYATAGTHAVCLQAGNAAGSAFSCALIEISDATAPVADFSWETIGDTTFFTDLSSPAPTSWIWLFGDGTAGSGQYPTHNYAVSGTYPVCMKAINAGGNDIICQLVDVCVPVHLSIAGSDSICPGESTTIQSTLTDAISFQWYLEGSPYEPSTSVSSVDATDAGVYTLTYTDLAGCSGTSEGVEVFVSDPPVVSVTLTDDQFCKTDGSITLGGGSPAGGTYTGPGISDGLHINPAMLSPGGYELTYLYTNEAGCEASATDSFFVYASPSASALLGSASNNLCVNTPVVLLANSGAGYTYQWYRNNTLLPGETSLAYLASTPGNYQVEVTNAEGCSKLSNKRKVISSGCRMAAEGEEMTLSVYPNPTRNLLNYQLFYDDNMQETVTLQIHDLQGRILLTDQEMLHNGICSGAIALDLPSGFYVLKAQTRDGRYLLSPFVIER